MNYPYPQMNRLVPISTEDLPIMLNFEIALLKVVFGGSYVSYSWYIDSKEENDEEAKAAAL